MKLYQSFPLQKTSKNPPIKKRNRTESTKRLLNAALEVFSEVGFDAATTKSIAQLAGLNESLIQRYFGSKAGLLRAVIQLYAEHKLEGAYPPGRTLEDEILNYLVYQYDAYTFNPNFVRVAFHSVLNNPGFMKTLEAKARFPEHLVSRLKTFQIEGAIKADIDLKNLAQLISSQAFVYGIMERSILGMGSAESHRQKFKFFAHTIALGLGNKK